LRTTLGEESSCDAAEAGADWTAGSMAIAAKMPSVLKTLFFGCILFSSWNAEWTSTGSETQQSTCHDPRKDGLDSPGTSGQALLAVIPAAFNRRMETDLFRGSPTDPSLLMSQYRNVGRDRTRPSIPHRSSRRSFLARQ